MNESTSLWTPFTYYQHEIFKPNSGNWCIKRTQFPFIESEAFTIHKSQSQTYEAVGINLENNILSRSLLYVALSRCKTLNGIYLFGARSVRKGPMLSERELFIKKKEQDNAVNGHRLEMTRLRKDPFPNVYPFAKFDYIPEENKLNFFVLNVENIGNYFDKLKSIEMDLGFRHADLIFLVECHSVKTNRKYCEYSPKDNKYYLIPEQNNLMCGVGFNTASGMICLAKKSIEGNFKFIAYEEVVDMDKIYEFSLHEYDCHKPNIKSNFFCCVYFHQGSYKKSASDHLVKFINYHIENLASEQSSRLYVFGDFNEDFNINKHGVLLNGLNSLELIPTIQSVKTHDKGKQLDWVFTNRRREKQNSQIYPVWYSDHAAIRTELELWKGIDLILKLSIIYLIFK